MKALLLLERGVLAMALPFLAGVAALGSLSGCFLLGDRGKDAAAAAEAQLKAGDIPGAGDAYTQAATSYASSVDAASGAAYTALLQGDPEAADKYLAAAEASAGERVGEVKLRRALVALEAGNLEKVKSFGSASGLPAGKLLAAEVALADGERDEAAALLGEIASTTGAVGATAKDYLSLIQDDDPLVAGLSEAQALWALGERKVAVRSVEELVKALPDDREDRGEQLMVWSSRAASVGEIEVARSILNDVIFPPEGQQWRKVATEATIACAEGDGETCKRLFRTLEGNAPEDGLADARATAAYLIAGKDPEAAKDLAGPYISNAAARALVEAGDPSAARESSPGGVFGKYLEAGG